MAAKPPYSRLAIVAYAGTKRNLPGHAKGAGIPPRPGAALLVFPHQPAPQAGYGVLMVALNVVALPA